MIDNELKNKIRNHNNLNPYVDITPYELNVGFPVVNYPGFFAQADEVVVYAVPASTFKDTEQVVGYTGKSGGVSVRVAKGVSLRTGASGGTPIRDKVRKSNPGDLIITNKRVVFIGKDDSFEFPVNKISAVKLLSRETFVIQSGRTAKNILVQSGVIVYAAGLVNYVVSAFNDGTDVIAQKSEADKAITEEQKKLCKEVSNEIIAPSKPISTETKNKVYVVKKKRRIFPIVLIVIISMVALSIMAGVMTSKVYEDVVPETIYSEKEILSLENHPRIGDNFEDSKEFYRGFDNVQVIPVQRHANIQMKLKGVTEDENLLYLIQDATHTDLVGNLQINLFSSEWPSDMPVDEVMDILLDFLPKGMENYYSQDSCYKYTQGTTDVYTYSCRLNEKGIEYHNDDHFEIPMYFYLRAINYTDSGKWKLETGISAYGDKDLGWIQKYTEPWEINLESYLS